MVLTLVQAGVQVGVLLVVLTLVPAEEQAQVQPVVQAWVQPVVHAKVQRMVQTKVKLVVQLNTMLVRKEKEEVVVQGHRSFQLLVGKANES